MWPIPLNVAWIDCGFTSPPSLPNLVTSSQVGSLKTRALAAGLTDYPYWFAAAPDRRIKLGSASLLFACERTRGRYVQRRYAELAAD